MGFESNKIKERGNLGVKVIKAEIGVVFLKHSRSVGYEVSNNIFDFDKCLLFDGALNLDIKTVQNIFEWLSKWNFGFVFYDYDVLLSDIVSKEDELRLRNVVYDLRVPFYRDDVIFVRNCLESEKFFEKYEENKQDFKDNKVALFKTIWEIKPFYIAIPKEIIRS